MPLTKLSRKYHLLKKVKDTKNGPQCDLLEEDIESPNISKRCEQGVFRQRKENISVIPETSSSSDNGNSIVSSIENLHLVPNGSSKLSSKPEVYQSILNSTSSENDSIQILPESFIQPKQIYNKITARRKKDRPHKKDLLNANRRGVGKDLELSNLSYMDCENWKRFESTHIDHLKGLEKDSDSVFTEDLSRISGIEIPNSDGADNETYHSVEEEPINLINTKDSINIKISGTNNSQMSKDKKEETNITLSKEKIYNNKPIDPKVLFSIEKRKRSELFFSNRDCDGHCPKVLAKENDEEDCFELVSPQNEQDLLPSKITPAKLLKKTDVRDFELRKNPQSFNSFKKRQISLHKTNQRRSILGRNEVVLLSSDSDSSSDDSICTNRSKCCWKKHILNFAPLPQTPRQIDYQALEKTTPKLNCCNPVSYTPDTRKLLSVSRLQNIEQWLKLSPLSRRKGSSIGISNEKDNEFLSSESVCNFYPVKEPFCVDVASKYDIDSCNIDNTNTSYGTSKKFIPASDCMDSNMEYANSISPEHHNSFTNQEYVNQDKNINDGSSLAISQSSHTIGKEKVQCSKETDFLEKNLIQQKNHDRLKSSLQYQTETGTVREESSSQHENNTKSDDCKASKPCNRVLMPHVNTEMNISQYDTTRSDVPCDSNEVVQAASNKRSVDILSNRDTEVNIDHFDQCSINSQKKTFYCHTPLKENPFGYYLSKCSSPSSPPPKFENSLTKELCTVHDKQNQATLSEDSDCSIEISPLRNSIGLQVSLDDSNCYVNTSPCNKSTFSQNRTQIPVIATDGETQTINTYIDKENKKIKVGLNSNLEIQREYEDAQELVGSTQDLKLHLSLGTEVFGREEQAYNISTNSSKPSRNSKHTKPKNIFGNYLDFSGSDSDDNDRLLNEISTHNKLKSLTNDRMTISNRRSRSTCDEDQSNKENMSSIDNNNPLCHGSNPVDSSDESENKQNFGHTLSEDDFIYAPPYPDHLTIINTILEDKTNVSSKSILYNDLAEKHKYHEKENSSNKKCHGRINLTNSKSQIQPLVVSKPTLILKTAPILSGFLKCHDSRLTFLASLSLSEASER